MISTPSPGTTVMCGWGSEQSCGRFPSRPPGRRRMDFPASAISFLVKRVVLPNMPPRSRKNAAFLSSYAPALRCRRHRLQPARHWAAFERTPGPRASSCERQENGISAPSSWALKGARLHASVLKSSSCRRRKMWNGLFWRLCTIAEVGPQRPIVTI